MEWSEEGTRRKLQYVTEIKTLVDSFSTTTRDARDFRRRSG
jgi:hypothetical protein